MDSEQVVVSVSADTQRFDVTMQALKDSTEDFGRVFSSTIRSSIISGRGLEDSIRSIGSRLSELALNQAIKPLENIFSNLLGSAVSSLGGNLGGGSLTGGTSGFPSIVPFARGGVVSSPTGFAFADKLGVMGEAGAEAIMPLRRGADGRLGVAASSSSANPVNVVFNVRANDVEGFRKSEGQVTALLARAVNRGQRGL